ncbi:MAG: circularly permuted type 2 ATP-grasp protein [Akkermansiaceae bacterium]|nr:circularly permuted type 2 ATP-grasp protein [Akkermansiaceae bacterium]MDP4646515.1 circularly permuted type 2 ATP-grasp protein [Akkermansiaceae bacterium]MDP4720488.1 circularly permuted type 2 ATP-grasp protein [Akkermansiaceae bacterium]MDP4779324.1 circularly permuted type 2 ATP-grasp protein [Akkermansiaceae bacterium]MDP4896532.1 circularly permuted type 2 ATP-grasp protein [Akkermansiaceae bacterium]
MNQQQRFTPVSAAGVVETAGTGVWNELLDRGGLVRPSWAVMWERIKGWSPDDRQRLLEETGRMLEDLGTTYNVYRDVGGAGQPYEIDPIPFIIGWQEWEHVAKGLAQRMRLLEAVLGDLYGPRKLLLDGLVPPDLVHASPAFHHTTRDIQPSGGKWLLATGCDLVRDLNGVWTVLRDHTHTPGGLGQTLENRSVVSAVLPDLFDASKVAKLRPFFDSEHRALQELETSSGGVSSMVFLTPGYQHPSYFEHAYKARFLGVSLVEAADLTVRERRLFMKTLGGLRKVDGVICRLEDDGLDPLEFWTSGGGGVPGLIEAWRSGNVALMNAPGSGFAGSAALQAFLPLICRKWFGEELILPFVESWWLGQKAVRDKLMTDLNGYVLISAFGRDKLLPVKWSMLSAASRKQWAMVIERRPWDFVVQKDIQPSIAPSIQGRGVQNLPVVWRAFTLNGADKPVVLPGGLAKVGKLGVPPQLWPDHEGFTKDVWLTGTALTPGTRDFNQPIFRHKIGMAPEVPSRIAEQLFWVGRYSERVESVSRMLRVTLRCIEGESGRRQRDQLDSCLRVMDACGLLPEDVAEKRSVAELAALIFSREIPGSLTKLVDALISNAASARDRLSDDTWIFFNQLKSIVDGASREARAADLLRTLDKVLLHLAAFSGMQAENMIRGQGWRFLEIGRRIERGRCSLALLEKTSADETMLEPLIEVCDSVMTYRRRYFSKPDWKGVAELLFSDRQNPRSVSFQIEVLLSESENFPGDHDFGLMPEILKSVKEIDKLVSTEDLPDARMLKKISANVESLSDKLTQHYFSHSVRRVY